MAIFTSKFRPETKFARSVKSDNFGKTEASDFPQQAQTIFLGERAGKDTKQKDLDWWEAQRILNAFNPGLKLLF